MISKERFIYILLLCLLLVSAVYIEQCSSSSLETKEYFQSNDIIRGTSMTKTNPTIFGVPIQDKSAIFMASATQSGMATPELQFGTQWFKGPDAYEASVGAIKDTLEMDQTQNFVRHHLAATMSGYIPPEGVPINDGLWYQRDFLKNLKQPGLVPYIENKGNLQAYGF
jgi:hypothetical protein